MKHVQKLVLVPIERWEKIGDNIPVKEITVKISPTEEYFTSEESNLSGEESEKSAGFGENSAPETNSYVSFPNSGEEEESNEIV